MGVIFASLRLSGKQPVLMDLFIQLVNISNLNSLSFNICISPAFRFIIFHISNNCLDFFHKNWLKRETARTVKFCFNILYAGLVFIPFDDIINPIRTHRRWLEMIFPVIQVKFVDNRSKTIIKSIRMSLFFRINSPFSASIISVSALLCLFVK